MRNITPQELLDLIAEGATVSVEDDKPVKISGIEPLIKLVERIAKANEELIRIRPETHETKGFTFTVERDHRNLIKTVEAVPKEKLLN